MAAGFDDSTRRGPTRRAGLLAAGWILPLTLLGSCSSSDSATDEAATTEATTATADESASSSTDDTTPVAPADDQPDPDDESMGATGPDGTFLVGDTFADYDFDFTYEGLVKVPLDPLGDYTDGECYFAIGSVTYLATSQVSDLDAFRAAFAPIIGGEVDSEQDDEFFNCDASAVGALGYTQSATTDVAVGETAPVWLDAIYLAPDRVGQLDGFQLYGDESLVFSAEVTDDVSS